jgi:hypothetical protein
MVDPTDTEHGTVRSLRLQVLGLSVRVDCADEATHAEVATAWARCLDREPAGDADLEIPLETDDGARALLARLSFGALGSASPGRVLFRAVGVADADGRVLALVGGTPKRRKTAILALARGGFDYVTDEVVAVGPRGDVVDFPRPLALDEPDLPGGDRGLCGPDELGLGVPTGPLELAGIVQLDPERGRSQPAVLQRMGLADGILGLARNVRPADELARPLQRLCELIERAGGVHRLSYDDIDDTTELLRELLRSPRPRDVADPWAPVGDPSPDDASVRWALMDGRVRQVPYRDSVLVGDDLLVVTEGMPVGLSALGHTIWHEAATAPRIPELLERVVEEHGAHPQAEELVLDAVTSMTRSQVLGYALPQSVARIRGGFEQQAAGSSPRAR